MNNDQAGEEASALKQQTATRQCVNRYGSLFRADITTLEDYGDHYQREFLLIGDHP